MRDLISLVESFQDEYEDDREEREFPVTTARLKDGREITIKSLESFDDGLHCLEIFAEIGDELVGDGKYDMDRGEFRGIEVPKPFRRLGVATAIYDYVENLGMNVKPSPYLQPDGVKFWDNRSRKG